jgi:cytochrome c553
MPPLAVSPPSVFALDQPLPDSAPNQRADRLTRMALRMVTPVLAALVLGLASGGVTVARAQSTAPAGNAAAGEQKNAMCVGCHGIVGYKTGFPEVHHVPKLYGQNARYIATALAEYKQGDRKHPSMRAVAQTLSAQDMADLGAYFASVRGGGNVAPAAGAADAGTAAALVAQAGCPACHGDNFNKPVDPAYPKLAGQHGDYLFVALKAYQTGDKALIGRANPIMGAMVKQLTSQQLQALARYIEGLSGDLATIQHRQFH